MKDKAIMDECYGKQIDYYNQFPNSSKVIENMVERLEKAESKNEKYKKYLFSQLKDCSYEECDIIFSRGLPAAPVLRFSSSCTREAIIDFEIDKNNEKIIVEIYQTDDFSRKTRPPVKILPTPVIIDINGTSNIDIGEVEFGLSFSFKNKACGEKRRREIEKFVIPYPYLDEEDNQNLFDFFNFLSIE